MPARHVLAASFLLATLGLAASGLGLGRSQDLPWTPLDLGQPTGLFTMSRLANLGGDPAQCRALLTRAGVRYTAAPPRRDGPGCGYDDGVRLGGEGARRIALAPRSPTLACPVAAALAMWEWNVVQPAAQARFGSPVIEIQHLGSYNCRRINDSPSGAWSEHATADALDIAGFLLADGTRITVARDWEAGMKGRFLHDVRDGACKLFATTLSPDYNAAHADHFHLDEADRGAIGRSSCR